MQVIDLNPLQNLHTDIIFLHKDKFDGKLKGVFIDIFNVVSERGKFTPIYVDYLNDETLKLQNSIFTPSYSFHFETLFLKVMNVNKKDNYIESMAFREENFRFIITPPDSYDSYDKLIMPFDLTTWVLLLATFLFAFIVIMIVNNLPRDIRNVVVGTNVQMPGFNIVSVFFGMGQTQLPTAVFSRFILMLFIIFCLIFRTAYQGVLYELITSDVQKSSPTTIDELIRQDFIFCGLKENVRHSSITNHLNYEYRNKSR